MEWRAIDGLSSDDEEAPYSRDAGTNVVYSEDFEANATWDATLQEFFDSCIAGSETRVEEFAEFSKRVRSGSVVISNMICENEDLRVHLRADSSSAYFFVKCCPTCGELPSYCLCG